MGITTLPSLPGLIIDHKKLFFTQRALYNYYYFHILLSSVLLLAAGLLLSQRLSHQEGGCLQLSAERDHFN